MYHKMYHNPNLHVHRLAGLVALREHDGAGGKTEIPCKTQ
jgi:hypothetical protein